eukprot:COSAG01_NODE_2325_length_7907_cov_4.765881_6_plen_97_part_00
MAHYNRRTSSRVLATSYSELWAKSWSHFPLTKRSRGRDTSILGFAVAARLELDRRFSAEIRGVSLGFMRTYKTYLSAKQEQDGHLFLPYDSGICGC